MPWKNCHPLAAAGGLQLCRKPVADSSDSAAGADRGHVDGVLKSVKVRMTYPALWDPSE